MPRPKYSQTKITDFLLPMGAGEDDGFDALNRQLDQLNLHKVGARFVGTMPVYVGGDIGDLSDSEDEEYDTEDEERFDELSASSFTAGQPTPHFSTRKWGTKKGKQVVREHVGYLKQDYAQDVEVEYDDTAISVVVQPLLNKMAETALVNTAAEAVEDVVSVSMGLNRMLSVSDRKNELLKLELKARAESDVQHKAFGVYWDVKWYNARGKEVSHSDVRGYYKKLKAYDKESGTDYAEQFVAVNEKGIKPPYQDLREYAKNHELTKELVQDAREQNPEQPVYMHVLDGDVESYNGVYSEYLQYIQASGTIPVVMSTGYGVTQELETDYPIVQAVLLDLMIRRATAKVFPAGVYYAEPNLCVLIPAGSTTVPESFRNNGTSQVSESAVMISNVLESRGAVDHPIVFIDATPLQTTIPDRFRVNKRGGDHKFSAEFVDGGLPTQRYLVKMQNISQTSLSLLQWAKSLNVNNALKLNAKVNNQKLAGMICRYVKGDEDDTELLKVMSADQVEIIARAYEARGMAIVHYRKHYMQAPDEDIIRTLVQHASGVDIDEETIDIIAGADILDLIEEDVITLNELAGLADETLQELLYNEDVINVVRDDGVAFEDIVEIYYEYFDGTGEDLSEYDISEITSAWQNYPDEFSALYNSDVGIARILEVLECEGEFIDLYVKHDAHRLDLDLDRLVELYDNNKECFVALLSDPDELVSIGSEEEFIGKYEKYQEQVAENEQEGYACGDEDPYEMMKYDRVMDGFDEEEYQSLLYPSGEYPDSELEGDDEDLLYPDEYGGYDSDNQTMASGDSWDEYDDEIEVLGSDDEWGW